MNRLDKGTISPGAAIRDAVKQLNENGLQILIVVDENGCLLGTVTDGDIRHAILDSVELTRMVGEIMNPRPKFLYAAEREKAFDFLREHSIIAVPILGPEGRVIDLVLWKDDGNLHSTQLPVQHANLIFILAGGRGTRLHPFTNILPKPLIPLGETPIIEVIMRRFKHFGFNNFVLSLNYKAEMIKLHFAESEEGFNIRYVSEKEFLGTAGSLSLIASSVQDTLITSNCDTILDVDLNDFFAYHKHQKNDATMIGVIRHVRLPYGVIEMNEKLLSGFREKPEFDFIVNAGVYAMEPDVVRMVPGDRNMDMPDLLMLARDKGMKVGIYPVSTDMIDVGHWDEYNLAVEKAKKLGFI